MSINQMQGLVDKMNQSREFKICKANEKIIRKNGLAVNYDSYLDMFVLCW